MSWFELHTEKPVEVRGTELITAARHKRLVLNKHAISNLLVVYNSLGQHRLARKEANNTVTLYRSIRKDKRR